MWAWPNDSTRAVRRSVARTGPALSLLTMLDAFTPCGCYEVCVLGGDGGGVVAHQLHTSSSLRDYTMWAWPNDSTRAVRRSVARTGPALSLLTMPDAFTPC